MLLLLLPTTNKKSYNLGISTYDIMILFVVLVETLKLNVQGIAYRYCTMLYENTMDAIKISVKLMRRMISN